MSDQHDNGSSKALNNGALERVMRDVLSGMEELACAHALAADCDGWIEFPAPWVEKTKAELLRPAVWERKNEGQLDAADYLITRELIARATH